MISRAACLLSLVLLAAAAIAVPPYAGAAPGAVTDVSYTLSGTDITIRWSPPGGDSLLPYYEIQRSVDGSTWSVVPGTDGLIVNSPSHSTVTLDHAAYQGADHYFQIFAIDYTGRSPPSAVLHVPPPDTSPPAVTVENPGASATIRTPDVFIDGTVHEPQGSGIGNVTVTVNGVASDGPMRTNVVSEGKSVEFVSLISGLSNGVHNITVSAANGRGLAGSGSVAVTVAVPAGATLDYFEENFDTDMSGWVLTTEDDQFWSVRTAPSQPVPKSDPGNKVAGAQNCDDICSMRMVNSVNLTGMSEPTLTFYRYVATTADASNSEGILVYTSENNGTTWTMLDDYTAGGLKDDGTWHKETYELTNSSSAFKVRFDARSSAGDEDVELDDILIYDKGENFPLTLTIPVDKTFEATGLPTALTPAQIGAVNVTGGTEPHLVQNNSTGTFPLGVTTISWNVTDYTGSTVNDTQKITVRDTTPPALPDPLSIAAKGPLTWVDLRAHVSDAVDSAPVLTHDAPEYLPFGNTTVTWNATDASGNSATATSVVTVTGGDSLDTSWYYSMGANSSHYAISPSKFTTYPEAILLTTWRAEGAGILHFFKSFPKDELAANGNVTVEFILHNWIDAGMHLRDGSYSSAVPADFGPVWPVSKGNGTLEYVDYDPFRWYGLSSDTSVISNAAMPLSPGLSHSQEDDVTVFIHIDNQFDKNHLVLYSVELQNHSKWPFKDYKVFQNLDAGNGTFTLVPPPAEASVRHSLPIHDTFNGTFDGWTYWGDTGIYNLTLGEQTGRKSVGITAGGFGTEAGISKTIDVSGFDETRQRLMLSVDHKISNASPNNQGTSRMLLFDADSGDYLTKRFVTSYQRHDTEWQTYTRDLTRYATDRDAIQIAFFLRDGKSTPTTTTNWYDDIRIYTLDRTGPDSLAHDGTFVYDDTSDYVPPDLPPGHLPDEDWLP